MMPRSPLFNQSARINQVVSFCVQKANVTKPQDKAAQAQILLAQDIPGGTWRKTLYIIDHEVVGHKRLNFIGNCCKIFLGAAGLVYAIASCVPKPPKKVMRSVDGGVAV